MYDLEREVNNLEYKLESDLQPRLETADNDVTHHKELIITAKERYRYHACIILYTVLYCILCTAVYSMYYTIAYCCIRYMESHDKCKKAEETIDTETENVKKYKKLVDEKFQEVSEKLNIVGVV